jgi:dehydration protein DpgD
MSNKYIQVKKKGHITIVSIDRPEVMNALHPPACREMDEAFNAFSVDPEAWVAIITGSGGKVFSAGNDLKWLARNGSQALHVQLDALKGRLGGIAHRFDCYKPLIAAVNGIALGGGFEIALACDIIVAVEHAAFGLPEPRVGLMAAGGGVHRLSRHIPYHLAMSMILTGRKISAQDAQRMGIVNELVAPEDLMSAAERWAEEILECAPLAVRASKEAVLKGLDLPLEASLRNVFPGAQVMQLSEDYVEGPRAFAEKRSPHWKGK